MLCRLWQFANSGKECQYRRDGQIGFSEIMHVWILLTCNLTRSSVHALAVFMHMSKLRNHSTMSIYAGVGLFLSAWNTVIISHYSFVFSSSSSLLQQLAGGNSGNMTLIGMLLV